MTLVQLIVIIVAFGFGLWYFNAHFEMTPATKKILNGVVVAVLFIVVLYAFGIWDLIKGVKVPKV